VQRLIFSFDVNVLVKLTTHLRERSLATTIAPRVVGVRMPC
jgi:hypothetical protein